MLDFSKILAVVDPTDSQQIALKRAKQICDDTQAQVTTLSCVYDMNIDTGSVLNPGLRDDGQHYLVAKQKEWCETISKEIGISQYIKEHIVVWQANAMEALNDIGLQPNYYDLIIKQTHEHNRLTQRLFPPVDWQLLRNSLCPVLLVKNKASWVHRSALIALNSTSLEDKHKHLNEQLIHAAHQLQKQLKLDPHLVNAYPFVNLILYGTAEGSRIYPHIHDTLYDEHLDATQRYANDLLIPSKKIHVKEGDTKTVITNVAKEIDIDVLVIGTMARHGLENVFSENTEESLIDDIDADVLSIRIGTTD